MLFLDRQLVILVMINDFLVSDDIVHDLVNSDGYSEGVADQKV